MKTLAVVLGALVLAGAAFGAGGKIYKSRLPDGRVVYADRPVGEDAEEVKLTPLQTYTAPEYESIGDGASGSTGPKSKDTGGYESFDVVTPAADAALRDGGGAVSIALQIQPALKPGHSIELFMDGKSLGTGRTTTITLTSVDRGTHSVYATVKDETGKELKRTPGVTFHLKRKSGTAAKVSGAGARSSGAGAVTKVTP